MRGCRCAGLPHQRPDRSSTSQIEYPSSATRPECLRQRILDIGVGVEFGEPTPVHQFDATPAARGGRESLLSPPRWAVGGDRLGPLEGAGGLPEQASSPGQSQKGRQRGRQQLSSPPKGETKGKGICVSRCLRERACEALHEETAAEDLTLGAKLPGERASTVKIAAFVNSMPRWIVKMNGGLPSFFRSMLKMPKGPIRASTSASRSLAWPMAVPFRMVMPLNWWMRRPWDELHQSLKALRMLSLLWPELPPHCMWKKVSILEAALQSRRRRLNALLDAACLQDRCLEPR